MKRFGRPGPDPRHDGAGRSATLAALNRRTRVRPSRAYAVSIVGATLVVFMLRLAIGLTDDAPSTDETAYLRSGTALWSGQGFTRGGQPELHFPPFAPFLLGGAGRLFGDPHTGTVLVTILSGTASIVPLAALGRRVAGPIAGTATAWVAALTAGISTTVTNQGAGSEAPYIFLVVTGLWATVATIQQPRRKRFLDGGVGGRLHRTRVPHAARGLPLTRSCSALRSRSRSPASVRAGTQAGALAEGSRLLRASRRSGRRSVRHIPPSTHRSMAVDCERTGRVAARRGMPLRGAISKLATRCSTSSTSPIGISWPSGHRCSHLPGRSFGYLEIVDTNVDRLFETLIQPEGGQFLGWLLIPVPLFLLGRVRSVEVQTLQDVVARRRGRRAAGVAPGRVHRQRQVSRPDGCPIDRADRGHGLAASRGRMRQVGAIVPPFSS